MPNLELRTRDHPEANGRTALPGEVQYPLTFPLEDGRFLILRMGQKGFDTVTQLLLDMLAGTPPYDDGTTPQLNGGDKPNPDAWSSEMPTEPGMYWLHCEEGDCVKVKVAFWKNDDVLWVECPDLGWHPLQFYHNGLTATKWQPA